MSREDVIRRLVERDLQDRELSEETAERDSPDLHAAACEHFGTWETALKYAGVRDIARKRDRPRKQRSQYSRDQVTKEIRELCLDGYNLTATRVRQRELRLYSAARRLFGTWRDAVRAAGIDPAHAFRTAALTKTAVLAVLQQRHQQGLSLAWTEFCLENRHVAIAARNFFRSWSKALLAAGIPPDKYVAAQNGRGVSPQQIIDYIQQRQQAGLSVGYASTYREQTSLISAARRHFGNWGNALAAAGVTPPRSGRPKRAGASDKGH